VKLGYCTPERKKAEVNKYEVESKMFSENTSGFKAQVTKNFIGLMVIIIIAVAVVIPVVQNVTEAAGLTGTVKTIVDLLPLLIAVALILIIVAFY